MVSFRLFCVDLNTTQMAQVTGLNQATPNRLGCNEREKNLYYKVQDSLRMRPETAPYILYLVILYLELSQPQII